MEHAANPTRATLIAELEKTRAARTPGIVYFGSANACQAGLDITVSWSDGDPQTPPQGAKLLSLTWDDLADLAMRYGRPLDQETVLATTEAVMAFREDGE